MLGNRYSSPIRVFISDESSTESDSSPITAFIPIENTDSSTDSDSFSMEWLWPQNQLGLEPEYLSGDDQVVALDKKGEIKYHEVIAKY